MTAKELALAAADDAFKNTIKTAISALLESLVLAKSDDEKRACLDRHRDALRLYQDVRNESLAAINAVLT